MGKAKFQSSFPALPKPTDDETMIHYVNGFCKQDSSDGYVRVYPDLLAPRFYVLVLEQAVKSVIVWSSDEMSIAGILPSPEIPYCSVGLEYGTRIQFVKITNVMVGSHDMKALIGLTPAQIRLQESRRLGARKNRGHDSPPLNGDSRPGEREPVDPPEQVSSAY